MRTSIRLMALAVSSALLAAPAMADTLQKIKDTGTITIGDRQAQEAVELVVRIAGLSAKARARRYAQQFAAEART